MFNTAVILAGGMGIRLRPYTLDTPKPLLPVQGKPIVEHIIFNLQRYGVKKIILSVGYKAEKIATYFRNHSCPGIEIICIAEAEPLGTGGAVKKVTQDLKEPFLLLWGDNLTDVNFKDLYLDYMQENPFVMMVLTAREDVENFGVAKLRENKVISFVEKPSRNQAPSNLINAGVLVINPICLELLPEGKSSIERDCFEKIAPLGKINAFIHKGQWFPTDTVEKYLFAKENFKKIHQRS